MLNVEVNPFVFPIFNIRGYWFDFSEGKLTLRNSENSPLFEAIHDPDTHDNILMTKQGVYQTYHIFISCDDAYNPTLHFRIKEEDFCITVDENGNEM